MLTLLNLLIDLITLFFTWESSFSSVGVHSNFKLSSSLSLLRGSFLLLVLLFPHLSISSSSSLVSSEYPPCSSCYLLLCECCLLPSPLNILTLLLEVGFLKCIKNKELEL
ncbi:unnamed protein product [Microthlaspi erraticum]|uniref:Uncharacterized protein n=1 Tax=Microthlaspi erraticum TaxID=1685480 RepID=A0A6D2KDV2_9BRAS|nr:unnamed protein product [Microthlaspi erraticum]